MEEELLVANFDEQCAIVSEIHLVSSLLTPEYPSEYDRPAPAKLQPGLRQYNRALRTRLEELKLTPQCLPCGVHIVHRTAGDDVVPGLDRARDLLSPIDAEMLRQPGRADARRHIPEQSAPQSTMPKAQRKNMARAQARARARVGASADRSAVEPLRVAVTDRAAHDQRQCVGRDASEHESTSRCWIIISRELVRMAYPEVEDDFYDASGLFTCFVLELIHSGAAPTDHEPPSVETRSLPWGVRTSAESIVVHRFKHAELASTAFLGAQAQRAGYEAMPCVSRKYSDFAKGQPAGSVWAASPSEDVQRALSLMSRLVLGHRSATSLEMVLGGLADGTVIVRQRSGAIAAATSAPALLADDVALDAAAMHQVLAMLDAASLAAFCLASKSMSTLAPMLAPEICGLPNPGATRPTAPPICGWLRLLSDCFTLGLLSSPLRFRHTGAEGVSMYGPDCVAAMQYTPVWRDFAQVRTGMQAEVSADSAEGTNDVCVQFLCTPGFTGHDGGFTFDNISRILCLHTETEGCSCGLGSSGFAIVLLDDGRLASLHLQDRECSVASGGEMFTAQISDSLSQLVTFALSQAERRLLGISCAGEGRDNWPFDAFAVVRDPPADEIVCGGYAKEGSSFDQFFYGRQHCRTLDNGLHVHYMQNHRSFAHYAAQGRDVEEQHSAKASWTHICKHANCQFAHCS